VHVRPLSSVFLHADGSLSESAPTDPSSSTSFVYDPANPAPTVGGSNLELPCGPLDQRPVESRPDVRTFTTDVLTGPLALTGPVDVTLWVESNCTDTDFTAKLTDVYPTGESRILNDGIVRMRWRDYAEPKPMVPGDVYQVTITLWNVSYIFSEGYVEARHPVLVRVSD
jgi:uncharacterized protein